MGAWRKLHNGELHKPYSLPNIFTMIKSRRMGWTRHVASMEKEEECLQDSGGESQKERDN
jgi:hypothetical protein